MSDGLDSRAGEALKGRGLTGEPLPEVLPEVPVGEHRPIGQGEAEEVVLGGFGGQLHGGHCKGLSC